LNKLLIIVLPINFLNCSFAQESSKTYSKWYLKPAVGVNIPITRLFSGEISDNLFVYKDNSYYYQAFSANYFFSSNWGVELTLQAGFSQNLSGREERYHKEIEKK
jgi:hypothetical protein